MEKFKVLLKDKIKTIIWAFKMAWKIDKNMLLLWFSLSTVLSALSAIALTYNKKIIAFISLFLSTGTGSISDVIPSIITFGIILTVIGLSPRINGDLLYMMMYDSYYLGMEEILMDFMQKIDVKTLLNKEIKDEYNAIISRGVLSQIL
ncbi:hypothetical protein KQI89_02265 [Clostridium sp. MSJ-4]|uniref:Uncharacterized protein n=1 Tax=Clostridium simiarum TaxID=2841506 RepID=A0ABS6EWH2_9CLOT|nr:hypothetical protein [Clostridium simiarum]MBU5590579.1 hypothetical protein [Clostridium simiarum]